jgi:23S rRNA (adenine2030-N6)-methyltransferase
MNYRHAFHAGNFADVHKHVVLLALLERLTRKPKPLLFLDTHAGRGRYDLQSADARRGNESQSGVARLSGAASSTSEDVSRYLRCVGVNAAGPQHPLASYPGSPLLAIAALRDTDRMVLVEQQPEEARVLRNETRHRRHVSVVNDDGYAALQTYLPPKENRGLVLIDPPYESADEFDALTRALTIATGRWSNGVYAVWYPIKASREATRFLASMQQSGIRKILTLEIIVRPPDSPTGLNGSGMLIINPPWQFDIELAPVLHELHKALSHDGAGSTRVQWLAGE